MTQRWFLIMTLIACCLQAQGNKWYNDEDSKRPYEFGFTIDGEQHRQEKKDENGIIMGEFGFLTADGVYHVTVYATDEDGNFKVLSMKNIRVKPYPTAATTAAPVKEPKALPFPPSSPTDLKPPPPASPARSCSSCSIPTSTTPAPQLTNIADVARDEQYPNYNSPAQDYPQQPQQPSPELIAPQDYPQQSDEQSGGPGARNPKQYDPQAGAPGQPAVKPVLISAQMQIVDKNTDIYARGPGEREGLPEGLDKKDMMLLLYTFNYTVGFHGHHEEGYTNGAKKGYYYVTGRNGVRTRVDYEADEKGFRPKITQEVLDLVSEDVPKEETEKDAKYGLKGYEFKWLYYPVDSKRR